MNLQALLERAREKSGKQSNSALARELGLSRSGLIVLLAGKHFPSDNVMLRIAAAARVPEHDALLMLNMWRCDGRARTIYGQIHKALNESRAPPKRTNDGAGRREQITA
jgi:transcriptional regulator with XRE-family HTH domain